MSACKKQTKYFLFDICPSLPEMNHMKNRKNITVRTKPGNRRYPNTNIYDQSLSWLGICSSIQSVGVELILIKEYIQDIIMRYQFISGPSWL